MTTTAQIIEKQRRLKVYETLEMKRRFNNIYEADWIDISKYLLDSSTTIQSRLDFSSYGYGEVNSGSAKFKLNNLQGKFNPAGQLYSLFQSCKLRHLTKLRYKAGYIDSSNNKIDETVFNGLLNEKSLTDDFKNGTVGITAQSNSMIFSENSVISGSLNSIMTARAVVNQIMSVSDIQKFITIQESNINFGANITFDNAKEFENQKLASVLTNVCKKTNSIWYLDINNNLIIKGRASNGNAPHLFIGGESQRRDCNILSISAVDAGFTKIINTVVYDTGQNEYQIRPDNQNIIDYGTQRLSLSGEDITNETTINTISYSIVNEWKLPKKRVTLKTVYSPNIYTFFDECKILFKSSLKIYPNKTILAFNQGGMINNDEYFGVRKNQINISDSETYVYYGFSHNVKAGTTTHYFIEK